jgi:hypothetical protein
MGKKKTFRAGRRKCARCKELWYRKKGVGTRVCDDCRARCSRCGDLREGKGYCSPCNVETTAIAAKAKDPTGEKARDYNLTRNYGITLTEYNLMLEAQGGVCFICGEPPKEGRRKLAVDHLHSKGEKKRNPREKRGRVRGLLCWQCNRGIGGFKDSVTQLRRAADYLEQWPGQQVLKKKEATDE